MVDLSGTASGIFVVIANAWMNTPAAQGPRNLFHRRAVAIALSVGGAAALLQPLSGDMSGIVLRGSAFAFRSYGGEDDAMQRRWGRTFAMASVVTPVVLGVGAGAVASGAIRVRDQRVVTDFVSAWLVPFPFAIGLFTLALFAFLAAVYLTLETDDPALRDDFRRRALPAAVAVGAMALVSFLLAGTGAPSIRRGLARQWWSRSSSGAGAWPSSRFSSSRTSPSSRRRPPAASCGPCSSSWPRGSSCWGPPSPTSFRIFKGVQWPRP
jgi:cytochrome bd-type quinol oxidase subunit 1